MQKLNCCAEEEEEDPRELLIKKLQKLGVPEFNSSEVIIGFCPICTSLGVHQQTTLCFECRKCLGHCCCQSENKEKPPR
jgi:hypothetical protein